MANQDIAEIPGRVGPPTAAPPTVDSPSRRTATDPRAQAFGASALPVSVIIPTRNRPTLAERAVRSALAQTLCEIEVIVVIDGPDIQTKEVLERLQLETGDSRMRVLQLAHCVGGSEARNVGVRFARGKWIALLDDDDEWHPHKLARQCREAESVRAKYAIVACRFVERTEIGERVLPARIPAPGEHFSEYLFVRRGWTSGEGFLQTSTWFVSRTLLSRVPFTRGLKRCQDLDWLLHATALPETEVRIVPEVLAIFHHDERAERVSRTADWRFLHEWVSANRTYCSPRAFSFFIATFCVPSAAKQGEGAKIFFFLLRECIFSGNPSGKSLLLFVFLWLVSEPRRRAWRSLLDSLRAMKEPVIPTIPQRPSPRKAAL